jgi:hypothetical protein
VRGQIVERNPEYKNWKFKGRTLGSIVNASNKWHLHMQKAKINQKIEWEGLNISDWEYEESNKDYWLST